MRKDKEKVMRVEEVIAEITQRCKNYGAKRIILFGKVLRTLIDKEIGILTLPVLMELTKMVHVLDLYR